jgi:hypothetical protein
VHTGYPSSKKLVSEQRVESQYDLELRAAVMHDILDMMDPLFLESHIRISTGHAIAAGMDCNSGSMPPEVLAHKSQKWIQMQRK